MSEFQLQNPFMRPLTCFRIGPAPSAKRAAGVLADSSAEIKEERALLVELMGVEQVPLGTLSDQARNEACRVFEEAWGFRWHHHLKPWAKPLVFLGSLSQAHALGAWEA